MQTLSVSLQAELNKGQNAPRILVDLYELYDSDATPGVDGFAPADALETFAAEEITWPPIGGIAYRREVISRGDISRSMGEKTNSVSLTFSNISRYMATLAQSQTIEGLILVIRCVSPSVTDDSIVLFTGRCEKPSDINKKTFTLDARQDFGNINQTLPPRKFTADDPEGRLPGDPLYEGIQFLAIAGSFTFPVVSPSTSILGRLLGRRRTDQNSLQWSSTDATPYGSVIREVFGRCQMELRPFVVADKGVYMGALWEVCNGPIAAIDNVKTQSADLSDPICTFTPTPAAKHLGDLGGTGTNTGNTCQADLGGGQVFSHLAYVEGAIIPNEYFRNPSFSDPNALNELPVVTAIVKGRIVALPDGTGVFVVEGWTDNPVHIARFVLTSEAWVNIDPAFMEDPVNYQTGLHCDEPLFDDSNDQIIVIPNTDLPQAGTNFTRYRSTGIINSNWWRFHVFGEDVIPPEVDDGGYVGIDPSVTVNLAIQRLLRKRYTFNGPITDEVRAVDFLYKTVFPTFKGFLRINKKGKYEIRSEVPSDATHLRSATAVAATSIPVLDVTPWKSGPDLLLGRLLLGFGLETAEVRDISSADYSTSGNSITLTAGVTGTITATASGANLSGGSTSVQASGTVTIGGTPAAGDTVTITIAGIAILYTVTSDDTTESVAAMLMSYINATPRLRQFIKAEWVSGSPNVITIKCLHGALNVSSAFLKAHGGPVADPTTAPTVAASSGGSLPAGTYKLAYADVNPVGSTALTLAASIVVTEDQKIDVSSLPAFPAGITSRRFYLSEQAGSTNLRHSVTRADAANFSITAVPSPGSALPPSKNTTGEELLRVAMSFATNSQDVFPSWPASTAVTLLDGEGDPSVYLPTVLNGHKYQVTTAGTTGASEPTWPTAAGGTVASGTAVFTEIGSTVLQQAGLNRANIVKDSYKQPMGSTQSSINQVKGSYRDAKNDFALTPYRVNDPVHQAQVKKIYPMEFDGSAIDNYHQFSRIANWLLSKHREGDWFNALKTGPNGLVLEEGDIICASDDSSGLINIVTRIEDLRIHPNHEVTINQARKYSTLMFSDDVGTHSIPVASTLRFSQTADSVIEFIDTAAFRPTDGTMPGFYVSITRDQSIEGDWRGSTLHADFGDGFSPIAKVDVPATIGEADTVLNDVADITVLDTTSEVDVTFKYVAASNPFSNATEAELLANPRRNLFLWGDELIQAGTIVDNGNRSFTLSDILHGRFETECVDHSIGERVVFIDGAEVFVPMDVSRLNIEYDYKAVTTNQDVTDATAVPFTWTGNILRPARPSDLNAVRDSSLDWYIAAIGHPRDAEIPETYTARLRDGSAVLLRDMHIAPWTAMAAMFEFYHDDDMLTYPWEDATITNNNVEFTYAAHSPTMVKSIQPIVLGGSANLSLNFNGGAASISLQDGELPNWQIVLNTSPYSDLETNVHWAYWTGGVNGEGDSAAGDVAIPTVGSVLYVRIVFVGSEVRVQLSGSPIIPTGPPTVVFKTQVIEERHLYIQSQGNTTEDGPFVNNVLIGGNGKPQTIYTLQQQTDDSGAGVDDLDVEMWQNSIIPGIQGRSVRGTF